MYEVPNQTVPNQGLHHKIMRGLCCSEILHSEVVIPH